MRDAPVVFFVMIWFIGNDRMFVFMLFVLLCAKV